ncbi:DUF1360 domain-containing protein [Robertmurraya yapensis]|uniref:DUF1360 domain-containing protein n=2 Tax=Bacillaceae TaxID=186817 RepID=A0A3S0RJP4_9BACI|nr:DUF1360 domain-containing protein [Bacillus yapensis]RTR30060.1 DUF1360 domain-containing protein [Bacillus yapensis]TKS95141.1 DUF1360 domain-containing protein [Bacillus yapensis]
MTISWMEIVIISLASFRLTRLIVFDKITEFLRAPFFEEEIEVNLDGQEEVYFVPKKGLFTNFMGELLSCYWCTGIWSTLAICIFYFYWPAYATPILIILAVAGIAAIIETVVQRLL